ncbi:hypothetical protein CR513_43001, partial [Mucuna pruriens]
MKSPQTIKEVQQLAKRISALSQFLSQSAETFVPIFNTRRKGDTFTCTTESEEAFLRLKALLASPNPNETDTQHSSTGLYFGGKGHYEHSNSAREGGRTIPDAERRYQKIEKAALILIIASRIPHGGPDKPTDQAGAEKTRLGWEDGSLECPTLRIRYILQEQRKHKSSSIGRLHHGDGSEWIGDRGE